MCGSMVVMQCPTAESRRGNKKEEGKKKPQDENIYVRILPMQGGHKTGQNTMSASATQGGHNEECCANSPAGDGGACTSNVPVTCTCTQYSHSHSLIHACCISTVQPPSSQMHYENMTYKDRRQEIFI